MREHTCSYYCERPECTRAQRDELRERLESAEAELAVARGQLEEAQKHCAKLTRMRFSYRTHTALVDRAERAESALAAAKAEADALRVDAERYRWLRLNNGDLDAAIDAARKGL